MKMLYKEEHLQALNERKGPIDNCITVTNLRDRLQ